MARRVLILRQEIEDLLSILDPAAFYIFSEYALWAGIVNSLVEIKYRIFARRRNRPSRERARDFDHVFLLVSAIDAQGVQLHQLAAIIFIQAAFGPERRQFFAWPRAHRMQPHAVEGLRVC